MTSPFIPRRPAPQFTQVPTSATTPSIVEMIRNLEAQDTQNLALQGVQGLPQQLPPTFEPDLPLMPDAPPERKWWQTALTPITYPLSKYGQLHAGVAGLLTGGPDIPGIGRIGISPSTWLPGGEEEQERRRLAWELQKDIFTGDVGIVEAFKQGQEIQETRSGFQKFLTETLSPLGVAEFLVPVTKIAKVAKPAMSAIPGLRTGQIAQKLRPNYAKLAEEQRVIRMDAERAGRVSRAEAQDVPIQTSQKDIISRIQNQENAEKLRNLEKSLKRIPVIGNLALAPIKLFNPNAIRDLSRPVEQFIVVNEVGREIARENASLMTMRVLSFGDPKKVFNLGDDLATTTIEKRYHPIYGKMREEPGTRGIFFNEIAQHPERYRLNTEQKQWLDNFRNQVEKMNVYLKQEGVLPDVIFTYDDKGKLLRYDGHKVSGDYFPNIWNMLDEIQLSQGSGKYSATHAFWEKSRFYETTTEALNAGFRPGDPMEAVDILFRSMYRQVHDVQLENIAKKMGNPSDIRISKGKEITKRKVKDHLTGSQVAENAMKLFAKAGPVDYRQWFGFAKAMRAQPVLMREFLKVTNIQDIRALHGLNKGELQRILIERNKEIRELARRAKVRTKEAQRDYKAASKVYAEAKEMGKVDTRIGEVEFSFRGGKLTMTPDDVKDKVFPESMVNNVRTMPRDELERLQKAVDVDGNSFKLLTDIAGAMRTLRAGTDLGVMLIHGLPTLFKSPTIWAKSTKHSLSAFRDPVATAKLVDDHWETVLKLAERNQLHGGGSEFIEGLRQGGLLLRGTTAAANKPGIGILGKAGQTYLNAIERQFDGWLLAAKIHLWEALEPMALAAQRKGQSNALDELASHVAKMTGTLSTANMGISPTTRNVMGTFLMFAPRYRMATDGLTADVMRGGVRGDQARRTVGKLAVAGMLTYAIVAQRLGQPIHLNPTDGKFMTLTVGDGRAGIGSAFVSLVRFGGNIYETAGKNPDGFVSFNTRDNPFMKFVRGQLSPLSGSAWDITSGRNFIGEPTHGGAPFFENIVAEGLLPFWASSYTDSPRPGIGIGPAEFLGFRGFPVHLQDQAIQLADTEAVNFERGPGKLPAESWDDLNKLEKARLLKDNPDIQELFDRGNRLYLERDSGLPEKMNDYRAAQRDLSRTYRVEMQNLLEDLQRGEIGAREFRNGLHAINSWRAIEYKGLNTTHAEAQAAIEDLARDPESHSEDIALQDYITTIVLGDFESEDGEFDFDRRQNAIDGWRTTWGDGNYAYVQEYLERDMEPLEIELRRKRSQYGEYWGIGKRILEQTGRGDLVGKWSEYMGAREARRREIEYEHPVFHKISRAQTRARQIMRDRDPKLDEFLYRWQYTDTLRDGTPNRIELFTSLLKY